MSDKIHIPNATVETEDHGALPFTVVRVREMIMNADGTQRYDMELTAIAMDPEKTNEQGFNSHDDYRIAAMGLTFYPLEGTVQVVNLRNNDDYFTIESGGEIVKREWPAIWVSSSADFAKRNIHIKRSHDTPLGALGEIARAILQTNVYMDEAESRERRRREKAARRRAGFVDRLYAEFEGVWGEKPGGTD